MGTMLASKTLGHAGKPGPGDVAKTRKSATLNRVCETISVTTGNITYVPVKTEDGVAVREQLYMERSDMPAWMARLYALQRARAVALRLGATCPFGWPTVVWGDGLAEAWQIKRHELDDALTACASMPVRYSADVTKGLAESGDFPTTPPR